MAKYVLKRLGYAVLTLFVLVTLTFFTMQLLPGDPFTGEKKVPEEVLARDRKSTRLNSSHNLRSRMPSSA